MHSSVPASEKLTRGPSRAKRYRPGSPQPFGGFCSWIVTSLPLAVHVPFIDGQPAPDSENAPPSANCRVKSRMTSGPLGSDCAGALLMPSSSAAMARRIAESYHSRLGLVLDAREELIERPLGTAN